MSKYDSHPDRHRLLQEYLLGSLEQSALEHVEENLEASQEWRDALECERKAMAVLDALPDTEPKTDLTKRVMLGVAERKQDRAMRTTWLKIAAGVAFACIALIIVLPSLGRTREAARRASSANNLKQLGVAFKMYANESKGELYPPLAPYKGIWTVDVEKLYPEFISDPGILVNPALPDASKIQAELREALAKEPIDWQHVASLTARSYAYSGWAIKDETDARMLVAARTELTPHDLESDLSSKDATVYRLREGIERFLITDINGPAGSAHAQSEVPIMVETAYKKGLSGKPLGRNVLYMDGHVEFVPFDAELATSEALDKALGIPHE